MSTSKGPNSHLRHALERDRLCDRFESELREGQRPRIEDFLAQVSETDRAGLFHDLLHIEMAWGGAETTAESRPYLERFPDFALSIQRIFANLGGAEGTASDDAREGEAEAPSSRSRAFDERARFRILRLHSQGGLGIVYVALDEQLDREVALKELQPGLANDPNARKRFEFEALLTSHLEHPGVVPVYAANHRSGGEPYYVSKLIRGESLQDAIQRLHQVRVWEQAGRDHQLKLQRLLRRFLTVCETVAYAHSVRIIHRDLKPNNILLSEFGETLIIDWGLAKLLRGAPENSLGGCPTISPF